ncbi:MAG: hypothetical protein HY306_13770 [Nitrosomonadales bacterium]|nr:hypothetical protein [Nitrosomonadales bacterium]
MSKLSWQRRRRAANCRSTLSLFDLSIIRDTPVIPAQAGMTNQYLYFSAQSRIDGMLSSIMETSIVLRNHPPDE